MGDKYQELYDSVKESIDHFKNFDKAYKEVTEEEGTINSKNSEKKSYVGETNSEENPHGFGRMEFFKDGRNYEGNFENGAAKGLGKYNFIY